MIGSGGAEDASGGAGELLCLRRWAGPPAWANVVCGVRGGRGVVPHRPQTLIPSSGSTTPSDPQAQTLLRRAEPLQLHLSQGRAEPLQLYLPRAGGAPTFPPSLQDRAGPRRGSSADAAGTIHGNEKGLWMTADTFFVSCPKVLEFLCYCALRRGLPRRGPARSIRIPPFRSASA